MSSKDPNCKCINVTLDTDDGKHKCMLCSKQFWPRRDPSNLPYLPSNLPVVEDKPVTYDKDGVATLGTKRMDNVRPKAWDVGNEP